MIIDGLRRCSDTRENQDEKPGRQMITFLIIANLCMYLWETMESKNSGYSARKKYYGDAFWTVVGHSTQPLCIFYRFHAAVAMVDIWSSAYRPGSHHWKFIILKIKGKAVMTYRNLNIVTRKLEHLEVKTTAKTQCYSITRLITCQNIILLSQFLWFFSLKCWFKDQIISKIHFRPV